MSMMNNNSHQMIVLFVLSFFVATAITKSAEQWKSRVIYQVITDRFAKTDNDVTPCDDLKDYCGGTFRGIINNLDYIAEMGFDAIWISPVIENIDHGYHGYWAKNFYKINPYFGTEQDLKDLIHACHKRDIWVMVDIVANHVGPVGNNFTDIVPFSNASFYHQSCPITDWANYSQVLNCRLADLPDLSQENEETRKILLDWIHEFVKKYRFDGIRLDTAPYLPKEFLTEFAEASGIFCIGEVFVGNFSYIAPYQEHMEAILNYPLNEALRSVFQKQNSMKEIQEYYQLAKDLWKDQTLLGSFINNHDIPRFLNGTQNLTNFKAAIAFSILAEGIPIVYQGDEQAFHGGEDPENREPLWTSMVVGSEMYEWISDVISIRSKAQIVHEEQTERFCDDNFYAFSRGDLLVAFTNVLETQTRKIDTSQLYKEGTLLCDSLKDGKGQEEDCITVQNNSINITLKKGETKAYLPINSEEEEVNFNSLFYAPFLAVTLSFSLILHFCY